MEAIASILGPRALDIAVTLVEEHINRAQEWAEQDVESCRSYLAAVHTAIAGLEAEYDQILEQARNCNLDDLEQIQQLNMRIGNYLDVDRLRPLLWRATAGLEQRSDALKENADRFGQWPWAKIDRQAAVKEFALLLDELVGYQEALEQEGLQHRPAGTGVAVMSLQRIQKFLNSFRSQQQFHVGHEKKGQTDLVQLVDEFKRDRTKDGLRKYTERIETVLFRLEKAFR
jgi:hypothetical protein